MVRLHALMLVPIFVLTSAQMARGWRFDICRSGNNHLGSFKEGNKTYYLKEEIKSYIVNFRNKL